jgi:hypothetical protein
MMSRPGSRAGRRARLRVGLAAAAILLASGCSSRPSDEHHPAPPLPTAAKAPLPADPAPAAAPAGPARALEGFWHAQRGGDWAGAYALLTRASRRSLSQHELAESAAGPAPTPQTAAAWVALFPGQEGAARVAAGSLRRARAEVRVTTARGPARVVMIRENAHWKVDLLATLNAAAAAPDQT